VGKAHIAVLPRAPTRYAYLAGGISPRLLQPDDNDSSNSSRDLAGLVSAASRSAREFLCASAIIGIVV
jgi:hypothetical protein